MVDDVRFRRDMLEALTTASTTPSGSLVTFGFALGIVWTSVAVVWVSYANENLAPHSVMEWIRAILLLPAIVFALVGEEMYRLGTQLEGLGVVAGVLVAGLIWTGILLLLFRRA
jgi:uncharacterized membrane protein